MTTQSHPWKTLDGQSFAGKRVLVRVDLNVPMKDGKVTDKTRIDRILPGLRELVQMQAKVILCAHFDRPKGKRVASMSLMPVTQILCEELGQKVRFAEDCVGLAASQAVDRMADGDVLLLENTRFHAGEEENDPTFAACLAELADIYINDAFSAAHRAHASTEGVARLLPAFVGRSMQAELEALDAALGNPERPVMAVVGGSKVSTKLDLLGNLIEKVDMLVIGGAMANTFLAAQGVAVGKSLQETDLHETARSILDKARGKGCEIILPVDATVATEFRADPPTQTVPVSAIPADSMMLDVGPETAKQIIARLPSIRTLVWNGPLGAFETSPFAASTEALAQAVATATQQGKLRSIAGGGDTVGAVRQAGVLDQLTYVSTAGGAFLEWLEGKELPGVAALTA